MESLIDAAADHFVYVLIAGAIVLGLLIRAVTTIVTTAAHERSRREIAAYIAEGSMKPEQGERLLRADVSRGQRPG